LFPLENECCPDNKLRGVLCGQVLPMSLLAPIHPGKKVDRKLATPWGAPMFFVDRELSVAYSFLSSGAALRIRNEFGAQALRGCLMKSGSQPPSTGAGVGGVGRQ
jgi:hypothetical protein